MLDLVAEFRQCPPMTSSTIAYLTRYLVPLLGGLIGAALGYFLFSWVMRQGFVPLALPGGFIGIGAGLFKGPRTIWPSIALGIFGLIWGAFCYWKFLAGEQYPFTTFLSNPQDLPAIHLGLLALGGLVAFWIPFRRR